MNGAFSDAISEIVNKAAQDYAAKADTLTKEQTAEALAQAILCGDFQLHVLDDTYGGLPQWSTDEAVRSGQMVTYIPYRRVRELEEEVLRLKGMISRMVNLSENIKGELDQ